MTRLTHPCLDTPEGFIRQRIVDIFEELAELMSDADMGEDDAAGLPITLFVAENFLLAAWEAYTSGNSEPDNLKQTNNEKETDRGPGLSGSELPEGPHVAEVWNAITEGDAQKLLGLAAEGMAGDLHIAEVEYHVYECGHGEIAVRGSQYHHLCPKCDDAMVDGYSDEEQRYQKWLKRRGQCQ